MFDFMIQTDKTDAKRSNVNRNVAHISFKKSFLLKNNVLIFHFLCGLIWFVCSTCRSALLLMKHVSTVSEDYLWTCRGEKYFPPSDKDFKAPEVSNTPLIFLARNSSVIFHWTNKRVQNWHQWVHSLSSAQLQQIYFTSSGIYSIKMGKKQCFQCLHVTFEQK